MKKTQSLKLMLLGLMASVSTSALAYENDVFLDEASGLIYQELAGKKAKLVAIGSIDEGTKLITIPTTVYNGFERKSNKPKELRVSQVSDDWYAPGYEIWFVKNGVRQGDPIELVSALDFDNLTLVIEAEDLTTISTKAIQPLNGKIKKFVVAGPDAAATPEKKGAGLTAIPDYAFFRATAIDPIENQAVRDAITALKRQKALIDYTIDGTEGQSSTKLSDGSQIYLLQSPDGNHDAILDDNGNKIYVVKSLERNNDGYYSLINIADGKPVDGVLAKDSPLNNGNLVNENGNRVAVPCWGVILNGLQDKYDAAQSSINSINGQIGTLLSSADYQAAVTGLNTAQQELNDAEGWMELYNTVKSYWLAAGDKVVNFIKQGPRQNEQTLRNNGITDADQIKAYNDLWDVLPNAKVTYKGKEYRYSVNANRGYDRPNSDNLVQAITDKRAALATAQDNQKLKDMANLEEQLAAAQAEKAAVEPYLNYWKGQRDGIAAQIKDKEDNELLIPQYKAATDLFGNVLNNEVLKVVHLYGPNLVGIGESAFQNCTEAVFGPKKGGPDSKIPLTTKTIGPRAFQNTIIDPVFDNLVDLESIGDFAFAQSGATTAVFTNATKLANFGTNVFDDCKLKNLLLLGTPLTAIPGNLAEGIYRDYVNFVDACGTEWNKPGDNEHKVLVNNTLKTVSLPAAITKIREGNFANCIVLATLDGGIPAGVTSIGAEAFFRTKIKEFDLSLLSKLEFIGEKAFAGNAQLTKVILPQNPAEGYALEELPSNVFECDDNLEDVILGPDVTCLPEGIFAGNTKMKKLDLSNTQIEILYNLFQAGDGTIKDDQGNVLNPVNNTLVEIILPEETRNDDGEVVIPGLKIIMDYALANLQALKGAKQADGTYKMIIPSSVYIMRPGVFSNDISLEYVEAMDSRLTNLGVKTFESCTSLKEFKFITLLPINPAWVTVPAGGLANMECGNSENGVIGGFEQRRWVLDPQQPQPLPMPGQPSPEPRKIYEWDYNDNGEKVANPDFSSLWDQISNAAASEEGVNYGTEYVPVWGPGVKFDAATFNFDDMQFHGNHAAPVQVWVTEESMNNLQGYYRQTYDNNLVQYSKLNKYAFKLKLDKIKDGSYAKTYYSTDFGTWIDTKEAGVFTAYQDYENVVLYKAKHNGGYFKIPAAHAPSDGREFAPDGTNYYAPGNFIWSAEDVAKPHNSAAVVIVSDKEEITIKRVTKPNEIYQSTLDRDNELRIAAETLEPSTHHPVHGFTFYNEAPVFYPYTSGKLYAGTVVLKASDYQGTGAPARIMNIIFVDDEATTIMGVKEYVKSLHNSDVIYNLNGMQVTTPVKGQIYIKGGKKFIQK